MSWRIGGLLVVSGVTFGLALNGPFVPLGVVFIVLGVLVLAVSLEPAVLGPLEETATGEPLGVKARDHRDQNAA